MTPFILALFVFVPAALVLLPKTRGGRIAKLVIYLSMLAVVAYLALFVAGQARSAAPLSFNLRHYDLSDKERTRRRADVDCCCGNELADAS